MNIAYVWQREDVDLERVNGPVLHVRAVVDALRRRGHAVRLLTFRDGQPACSDDWSAWHPLQPELTGGGWFRAPERAIRGTQSRLRLPFARLFDSARFADAMLPALEGFDVLYERFDLLASAGLMAARRRGLPLVVELNGNVAEEYAALGIHLPAVQWRLNDAITRRALAAADQLVAVSEPLREQLIEGYGLALDHVTTILNGAQVEDFARALPDRGGLFGGEPDHGEPVVLFVGVFAPWHGLDLLLDAFARLPDELPARLALVGDGPDRAALEARAAALGLGERVTFTGLVPHSRVPGLLTAADIGVVAHRDSPMGRSVLPLKLVEYMASGLAVVAPATDNLRALLEDGRTARLYAPGDADALAGAIAHLLRHPAERRALGTAAQATALAGHSWDRTTAEIEALLERLVAAKRPAQGASR